MEKIQAAVLRDEDIGDGEDLGGGDLRGGLESRIMAIGKF